MTDYQYAVEHKGIGFDLGLTEYKCEEEALAALAVCLDHGIGCALFRREVGPWVPAEAVTPQ